MIKRTQRTSRIFTVLATFASTALFSVTTVLAQEEERRGGAVSQSQTSIVEYLVVAALLGAALFAVCRTSHRV
jgi:outer membrane protein assembly factor BamE (lipoprotein component of BamABCDE complex)